MGVSETNERQEFLLKVFDEVDEMLCGIVNVNGILTEVNTSCVRYRFKTNCDTFTAQYGAYLEAQKWSKKHGKQKDVQLPPDPTKPTNWRICGALSCYYATLAIIYNRVLPGSVDGAEGDGWFKRRNLKDVTQKSGDYPFVFLSVTWPLIESFRGDYDERIIKTALQHVKKDLIDNCRLEQPTKADQGSTRHGKEVHESEWSKPEIEKRNEEKPQTHEDVAELTNAEVHNPYFMAIFRNRDRSFYSKVKRSINKYRGYIDACKKLQEDMIFKDSEYRALCDKEEKLSKDIEANEKNLSEKIGNSKTKQKDVQEINELLNELRNKHKAVLKKRDDLCASLYKRYEHEKAKITKPDAPGFDIFQHVYFPRSYYDRRLAHIINALDMAGWEDSSVPDDKELYLLADYVRLTILHDRCLNSYRDRTGIDPINNSIWTETEQWVEDFWAQVQEGWNSPDVTEELYLSYKNVKQDLETEQEKLDDTSLTNIEKLKAIIKKLGKLKYILSRLAFYRQQENDIDKDVGIDYRTKAEGYRRKVMNELNKAKELCSDGWSEASLERIRSEISADLVEVEGFIIENSLDGDNELLKKIYETVRDSEESQEIQEHIVDLEVICRRAEKKPAPEGPPRPGTTDDEGGGEAGEQSDEIKEAKDELGVQNKQKGKQIKPPSKKAIQAYLALKSLGCTQEKLAEIMLKDPKKQYQISRWKKESEAWLKAAGLDVFPPEMTKHIINLDPKTLDMGARTDGRITGDERHRIDPDGDADE